MGKTVDITASGLEPNKFVLKVKLGMGKDKEMKKSKSPIQEDFSAGNSTFKKPSSNGKPKKALKRKRGREPLYEVESVVGKRETNGFVEYFVKWFGFPEEENTWEPEKNLIGCSALLEAFEAEQCRQKENKDEHNAKKVEIVKEVVKTESVVKPTEDEVMQLDVTKPASLKTAPVTTGGSSGDSDSENVFDETEYKNQMPTSILTVEKDAASGEIYYWVKWNDGQPYKRVPGAFMREAHSQFLITYLQGIIKWVTDKEEIKKAYPEGVKLF